MRTALIVCCVVIGAGCTAAAQSGPAVGAADPGSFSGAPRAGDLIETPRAGGFSLLDPSRFKMSQSYTMSYFSGSGYSGSTGLYMNTIEYRLSEPLTVRVGLGYLHQPLGFLSNSGASSKLSEGRLLPSFSLLYRPSNKFQLLIDYRTVPAIGEYGGLGRHGISPYSGFYDPWHW
ncbi:MAG TPA: hypothetical protein VM118_01250 [Acidobacteriota bacterium]|nr:hypothetical protein [Acidobacteriota bacterium]